MKLRPFGSFSFHKGFELLSPQNQGCAQAEGHSTDIEQERILHGKNRSSQGGMGEDPRHTQVTVSLLKVTQQILW